MRVHKIYIFIYLFLLCIAGISTFLFINRNVEKVIEQGKEIDVEINGKCACIVNVVNGEVLFGKNAKDRYPPASTAKVMTAVVAIENMDLETKVVPTQRVVQVEPTIAGLKPGVSYKLGDLLSAILIKSANDAAFVIAESIAGSEREFAVMMNNKAKEIGMRDTYFETASGLPTGRKDSQYTTAEDLAKLMLYAQRYKIILKKMSKKTATISGSDGKNIYLKTHNKALFRTKNPPWGKTGYTREAKRTFIGIDPDLDPMIAFGLLQSNDLWQDIMTLKDKGLMFYRASRIGFVRGLILWVKQQREIGRQAVAGTKLKSINIS